MQFGFTLKPGHTIERTLALTRQAEAAGFEYGWLFDSHVLWRDPYPLLTLMAEATTTMRLGTCVTNPATRALVTASRSPSSRACGRMTIGCAILPRVRASSTFSDLSRRCVIRASSKADRPSSKARCWSDLTPAHRLLFHRGRIGRPEAHWAHR
jgi:hypothetical protein